MSEGETSLSRQIDPLVNEPWVFNAAYFPGLHLDMMPVRCIDRLTYRTRPPTFMVDRRDECF